MGLIEALILGIIQGLTEFLPVSSSGHLEIGSALLQIHASDHLLFSVMVHGATALSTVIVFRKLIWTLIQDVLKFQWNDSTKYLCMLALSMIPVGIVGVFFEDQIEAFFGGKIIFVASMLMITGILLTITHFAGEPKGKITFSKAIIIGIAQAVALLPGISRSGATISTALILGISRDQAARFSFLMVLAPILGATLLKFKDYMEAPVVENSISGSTLAVGFLAALISGILACTWMIKIVNKGKLIYFALYCFIVATITILFSI